MNSLGIDIGTTTISAVKIDENSEIVDIKTVSNDSTVISGPEFDLQDPGKILTRSQDLLEALWDEEVASIGVTGQMHGILYVDDDGRACSNLATWQDARGDSTYKDGFTFCEYMNKITGLKFSTGFGLSTLFWDTKNQKVPDNASSICTIPDYVAINLTGIKRPVLHNSMAQSLGGFNIEQNRFDTVKLTKLGIPLELLPDITDARMPIGDIDGVKVYSAIGDNQASVLGTCRDEATVLLNIGTGSQVSVISDDLRYIPGTELRPYLWNKYLITGNSLCGGSAYDVLVGLISDVLMITGNEVPSKKEIIRILDEVASEIEYTDLSADTRFRGTREDRTMRGSISGISWNNFKISDLARAFIYGICNELKGYYDLMPDNGDTMCISGNAVRNSEMYRSAITELFSEKKIIMRHYKEEAAFGAALFATLQNRALNDVKQINITHILEQL